MPGEFSFLSNDFKLIMRYAHLLLPGIRRVDAVYYSTENEQLEALTVNPQEEPTELHELGIEGSAADFEKLRKVKAQFSWFSEEELPIQHANQQRRIPDFFDELSKVILVMRIPNEADSKHDLLFFYFKQNMTGFGMNLAKKEMSAENKEIIAHMVMNSFRTIQAMAKEDRTVWQNVKEMIRENRHKMEQNRQKLEETTQRYGERLVDSCNYFLSGISAEEGRKYIFSKGALELIKSSTVDYHRIENAIKLAVQLAKNFGFGEQSDTIEITEDFLNFNASKVESEENITETVFEKPFHYLNLWEEAAVKVKASKRPVTAQNLVSEMDKPVNPSAITWVVNHNMQAFKQLFKLYPDNWSVIRSEFRPILRILNPDDEGKKKRNFGKTGEIE